MPWVKLDFLDLNQFSTLAVKDRMRGGLKVGKYLHFSFNEKLEVISSKLKNCDADADMQVIEFSGFLLIRRR